MYRIALSLLLCCFSAGIAAQTEPNSTTEASAKRTALLKEFVVQERGEITVIQPSSKDDGSAIIGYSSGSVLVCYSYQNCSEFGGTPNAAVQQIAVSKNGASSVIWVAYRQGALYQCTKDMCTKHIWDGME